MAKYILNSFALLLTILSSGSDNAWMRSPKMIANNGKAQPVMMEVIHATVIWGHSGVFNFIILTKDVSPDVSASTKSSVISLCTTSSSSSKMLL